MGAGRDLLLLAATAFVAGLISGEDKGNKNNGNNNKKRCGNCGGQFDYVYECGGELLCSCCSTNYEIKKTEEAGGECDSCHESAEKLFYHTGDYYCQSCYDSFTDSSLYD